MRPDLHILLDNTEMVAWSLGSWSVFSIRYEVHTFRNDDTTPLSQAK